MRIATWNVAYGVGKRTNDRRLSWMADIDPDVWILTETHDTLSLLDLGYKAVHGGERPLDGGLNRNVLPGSRWVSIWSRPDVDRIVLQREDPRRVAAAVSAASGRCIVVYGTVLPWGNDTATQGMRAELAKQAPEWDHLQQQHDGLCVAGDFNVNLGGPHYYGSRDSKDAVAVTLRESGLVSATRFDNTPDREHGLIDHIAVPASVEAQAVIDRVWGERSDSDEYLSDHSGVSVDVRCW